MEVPPKTAALSVTTLDLDFPDDVKGRPQHALPSAPRDLRSFRVPHNYQQYQQTILSRSITSFTGDHGDQAGNPICVHGERIEGRRKESPSEQRGDEDEDSPQDEEENYQMNAMGETNISFYDFQRTWSIEDYECEEQDSQAGGPRRVPPGVADNKVLPGRLGGRRIMRPPSPKTKQIIRVNVVRVSS